MRGVSIAIGLAFALSLTAHATEPPAGTNPVYSNTLSPEAIMALGDECIDLLDRDETAGWYVQLARKCSGQLNAVLELRKKDLSKEQSNAELWASARLRTSMFIILNRLSSPEFKSLFGEKDSARSDACHEMYWAYNHLRDMKRPYMPLTKSKRKAFKKIIKPAFKVCFDVRAPMGKTDRYKITRDLGLLR